MLDEANLALTLEVTRLQFGGLGNPLEPLRKKFSEACKHIYRALNWLVSWLVDWLVSSVLMRGGRRLQVPSQHTRVSGFECDVDGIPVAEVAGSGTRAWRAI